MYDKVTVNSSLASIRIEESLLFTIMILSIIKNDFENGTEQYLLKRTNNRWIILLVFNW